MKKLLRSLSCAALFAPLLSCAATAPEPRPFAPASTEIETPVVRRPLTDVAAAPQVTAAAGLQAGDAFVDFGLPRLDLATGRLGASVWLSDFLGPVSGSPQRVVLLSFFAVWCSACFEELPVLNEWQERYGARGLQVLGVNVRAAGEDADEVIRETRLRVSQSLSIPLLFERYTIRNQSLYLGDTAVLPASLLLGADGRVLERVQGAAPESLEKLRQLIEQHVSESATDGATSQPPGHP